MKYFVLSCVVGCCRPSNNTRQGTRVIHIPVVLCSLLRILSRPQISQRFKYVAMEPATPEQLQEYESQLENVKQLLEASPEDESLESLKSDLEELVALTRSALVNAGEDLNDAAPNDAADSEGSKSTPPSIEEQTGEALESTSTGVPSIDDAVSGGGAGGIFDEELPQLSASQQQEELLKKAKKKKKSSDQQSVKEVFELPSHLIVLDTDTDAERNKKRRTAKALKNKWREKKKEMESNSRQASWQTFQKKNSKNGKRKQYGGGGGVGDGSTIFSTQEGSLNDRVGVISKKQMTSYDSRKRHKY